MGKKILVLVSLFFLSACAGPLVLNETARTLGELNQEFSLGSTPGIRGSASVPTVKWNIGVSPNTDFGIQVELLTVTLRAKHAFLNKESGLSLATAIGVSQENNKNSRYAILDLMGSYLFKKWEPYGTIRIIHADSINNAVFIKDPPDFFEEKSISANYSQLFLGTRYWLHKKWFLSLEVSKLISMSKELKITKDPTIMSLAFGHHF